MLPPPWQGNILRKVFCCWPTQDVGGIVFLKLKILADCKVKEQYDRPVEDICIPPEEDGYCGTLHTVIGCILRIADSLEKNPNA